LGNYTPILRGKSAEYGALKELDVGTILDLKPYIQIPHQNQRDIETDLARHVSNLKKSWPVKHQPVIIDTSSIEPDSTTLLATITPQYRWEGLTVCPAITMKQVSNGCALDPKELSYTRAGVAVRLTPSDFENPSNVGVFLKWLMSHLLLAPRDIDVYLDFGAIDDVMTTVFAAERCLKAIPHLTMWRKVYVAATGFPERLAEAVPTGQIDTVPRLGLQVWERLADTFHNIDLGMADYVVDNPDASRHLEQLTNRPIVVPVDLRYTTDDGFLIFKGGKAAYGLFFDHCETLVTRPEFKGGDFSWGDAEIACRAHPQDDEHVGPGNAMIWRKIAINHHLTLAALQLSTAPVL
jgi:hypothetical protein